MSNNGAKSAVTQTLCFSYLSSAEKRNGFNPVSLPVSSTGWFPAMYSPPLPSFQSVAPHHTEIGAQPEPPHLLPAGREWVIWWETQHDKNIRGTDPSMTPVSSLSTDTHGAIRGHVADTCSSPQSNELWEKWRRRRWIERGGTVFLYSFVQEWWWNEHWIQDTTTALCIGASCFCVKAVFGLAQFGFHFISLFPWCVTQNIANSNLAWLT